MTTFEKLYTLTSQLFPTGRAFRAPKEGDFDKLKKALARSEARFFDDAKSVLNSQLPDNDDFTAQDATDNERRYGLITNSAVSLADRKLALIRKINHPGTIKARQNYRYLEKALQDAGFAVYVHENRFDDGMGGYVTQTPEAFSLEAFPTSFTFEHGAFEHGEIETGGILYANQVVNSIDQEVDDTFNIGDNLRSTFFIGGSVAGSWANVDQDREQEFRELILKVKPRQTVGFLLIHYI